MSFWSDAGDLLDKISYFLHHTGELAAELLDIGAKNYNNFISFAHKLVTKDIKDGTFSNFWEIIDFMNSVFVVIASTLLVMLFFYSLYESSMESRAEVSMWRTVFDYLKLLIANVLIVNSLNIVVAIFRFGTNVATMAVNTAGSDVDLLNNTAGIPNADKKLLANGIHGFNGFFVVIIALIGAVVMVSSAIAILLEIFKRFYKVFVLIPFASLSFSTFVLPDNKGNEIFKGYIKNALVTSLEAAIIVFCLAVSSSLMGAGAGENSILNELFTVEEDNNYQSVKINNENELIKFNTYCNSMTRYGMPASGTGYDYLGEIDYYYVDGNFEFNENANSNASGGGVGSAIGSLVNTMNNSVEVVYPVYGYAGNDISMGSALLLVVKCILPMILTAAVIKEVPGFASKALGM